MTILNLNGPTGRAPRGKKTVRAWMGVGLVIAVLGIGSTFAASININGNSDSEFGQGVTKTVYCGGESATIKVTPASAFVNSYDREGVDAVPSRWIAPTWSTQTFVRVSSSSSQAVARSTFVNELSGATETNVTGYWVTSRFSNSPSWSTSGSSTSQYAVFAPQIKSGSDYGFYKYTGYQEGSFTIAVAGRESEHRDSKFELKGITVSGIPSDCSGRDFILSAYGDDEDSLDLIDEYTEIAIKFTNSTETPVFSFDRNGLTANEEDYARVTQRVGQIVIIFDEEQDRINADDLENIVVETQVDLLS